MKAHQLSLGIPYTLALFSLAHSVVGRSDAGDSLNPPSSYYDDRSSKQRGDAPPSYWHSSEQNREDSSQYIPPPPPPNFSGESSSYGRNSQYLQQDQGAGNLADAVSSPDANEYVSSQSSYQNGSNHNDNNYRPSSESSGTKSPPSPIHYDFPAAAENDDNGVGGTPAFSSARRDLITTYMSTTSGKLKVMASSTVLGGGGGVFLAKSMIPVGTPVLGSVGAVSFLVGTMVRTPFGELVRALGLSFILVLQRTSRVRKKYPTWRYVAAFFGISSRNLQPFPPSRNPWKYTPRRPDDVDFSMLYSIIAMAFVGSFCGGNMPVMPVWMGSLIGAGLFALGCTLSSSRGDLCRTMGMRVVALLQELWDIQADLKIIPKAAVVSSQVLDKFMIFDRKHRVKDRFLSLVTRGYDQVMQATSQTQRAEGRRSQSSENDERGRRPRDQPYGQQDKDDGEDGDSRREPSIRRERDNRYSDSAREKMDIRGSDDRYGFEDDWESKRKEEKPKRRGFWRK